MNRYRNKLVYDASTGEIRDDRNHMSMLEDFCFHAEKVVEEQRSQHFPAVLILERLMISYTSNGNYTVHLTCRFQDLKQSKVSLSAEQLKSLETNLNSQSSYNVSVRSLPRSSQTS